MEEAPRASDVLGRGGSHRSPTGRRELGYHTLGRFLAEGVQEFTDEGHRRLLFAPHELRVHTDPITGARSRRLAHANGTTFNTVTVAVDTQTSASTYAPIVEPYVAPAFSPPPPPPPPSPPPMDAGSATLTPCLPSIR